MFCLLVAHALLHIDALAHETKHGDAGDDDPERAGDRLSQLQDSPVFDEDGFQRDHDDKEERDARPIAFFALPSTFFPGGFHLGLRCLILIRKGLVPHRSEEENDGRRADAGRGKNHGELEFRCGKAVGRGVDEQE